MRGELRHTPAEPGHLNGMEGHSENPRELRSEPVTAGLAPPPGPQPFGLVICVSTQRWKRERRVKAWFETLP